MLRLYVCLYSDKELSYSDKLFSDYRKKKLSRQMNPHIRKQSVVSELLLGYALRESGHFIGSPLSIVTGQYGKPALEGKDCHFSLSHSDHAAVCALSDGEVGADIQKLTPIKKELVKRYFAAEEQSYVQCAAEADRAFTMVWTMKESFCKYSGEGLHLPLASFNVFDPALYPRFQVFDLEDYQMSVFSQKKRNHPAELILVDENALCR